MAFHTPFVALAFFAVIVGLFDATVFAIGPYTRSEGGRRRRSPSPFALFSRVVIHFERTLHWRRLARRRGGAQQYGAAEHDEANYKDY